MSADLYPRRVTLGEYVRRLPTASAPFEAYARAGDGEAVHVCVKPILKGRPETVMHVVSEIVAAAIARRLGVPVPEPFFVDVPPELLAASGSELADVEPGCAYGSKWVEGALPLVNLNPSVISNPDSVAGVTVLDTLIGNGDRHSENVLLHPDPQQAGRSKLIYIDNAYAHVGVSEASSALTLRAPRDLRLRELVTSQEMFMPYLVAAEGLAVSELVDVLDHVIKLGLAPPDGYAERLVAHLENAIRCIRSVVMDGIAQFPLCQ
ncbi:MAG: hypothetical protein KatS3mg082_3056 [Nitrospiraceae bacterium]|nr:MAG: hypothetical protein KatS3mg082_3056 [Nitrospiraceae bacterium]